MKSRITIEVNFDENNLPVIQVLSHPSDDVRDKLIQSFLQSLRHSSRWCKILYMGNASTDERDPIHKWHIIPIRPSDIPEEVKLMNAVIGGTQEPSLFSRFAIDDEVDFTTPKAVEYARKNEKNSEEVTPEYFTGKVTAIKFTKAKVWYDVADDYSGLIFDTLPSDYVKKLKHIDLHERLI